GEVRVLQAKDPSTGAVLHTMLDFSAHATVLGGQPLVSGDWPQAVNAKMQSAFGGDALTVVGTLGRTQPEDSSSCTGNEKTDPSVPLCELDSYASKLMPRIQQAIGDEQELTGTPVVDSAGYLIRDPATNAFLLALLEGGSNVGAPVNRADTDPWLVGND